MRKYVALYIAEVKGEACPYPRRRAPLVVPIAPGAAVDLAIPVPMTSGEWDQMMKVMTAMRPGLVG